MQRCRELINSVNTNNIWVNLKAIKRIMDNDELSLEIIVNNKVSHSTRFFLFFRRRSIP